MIQVMSYVLRVAGYELLVTDCGFQVADFGFGNIYDFFLTWNSKSSLLPYQISGTHNPNRLFLTP